MSLVERENTMRDLERVKFVTENYEQLQGLRWVWIGLYFCLYPLFILAIPSTVVSVFWALPLTALFVVIAAGMFWAQRAIGRYYKRRFGEVRHKRWTDTFTLPVIASLIVLIAAFFVNETIHPPVDLALLGFGVIMLVVFWPDRRFRIHYLVMMPFFVAASFLPLWGVWSTGWSPGFGSGDVFPLFLGLYWVVGGIFDHLLLVRTMKSVPEEADGGAV